jgi:hypothetical protein
MARYGDVPTDNKVLGEFIAKKAGLYSFKLYPQLWSSPELAKYYSGRKWEVISFVNPPPRALPTLSGIYMFVVGPYCGGLQDHSYIFYVGKTNDIKERYSHYLREKAGRVTNPREEIVMMLNNFDGYLHFHYTLVPEDELTQAEGLLKDNLTPVANTQLDLKGRLTA